MSTRNEELLEAIATLSHLLTTTAQEVVTYQPLADRILVLPLKQEGDRMTKSGLHLPQSGRQADYRHARVVAVGPGPVTRKGVRIPIDVEVGEIVIVGSKTGFPVDHQDVEYRMVKWGDVLAKVNTNEGG